MGPRPRPHSLVMMPTPFIVRSGEFPEREAHWLMRARETLIDVHPRRLAEWALGRVAWERAMAARGQATLAPQWLGHQQVSGYAGRFSISHTPDWAAAVVDKAEGLGVDIEVKGRKVSPEICQRMAHVTDQIDDPLSLWAIKEAAYKTLPAEIQSKVWLNSIAILNESFEVAGLSGRWCLYEHPDLVVCVAHRV